MLAILRERTHRLLMLYPALLARLGLVDRKRGAEAFDLAIPVMVSGGMRTLLRIADFFMVSLALGGTAVAALELGFQYYFVAFGLALGLTSGTISVVSRATGEGDKTGADFAVKQSLWLSLLVSVPLTLVSWVYADVLVGLLTNDSQVVELGATYLRIVMLSAAFRFWNMTASRGLAGAGDTRTPMYVRLLTLPTNIGLNAVLIFGLLGFPELGVAGAAWGTVIANTLASVIFFALLVSGRYSVRLRLDGKQWDTGVARELVRVGLPLAGTRLSRTFGRFPFLFILGVLGTDIVAAYAIGRRVMLLALMPAWGYSTASSTLVGQHIGAGDAEEADAYGWQTLRIALVTQLAIAAALFVGARPLAELFGAGDVGLTVTFIHVFGLGVAGFSVARTLRGGLRGAGDTRWPLYGGLVGTYAVRLPLAALALPVGFGVSLFGFSFAPGMGLGLTAVFAAITADFYARAAVNGFRYWSGAWKDVAQRSGVGASAD
ncbi:MATE family efflux transporter [Haloprofundus marisrubri]|uniref:Multidrug-efflux transporter n=1 Tax=Haloprofundus marisrubri TaxID=1514971 RepID=A0A0W1R4B7_9EURY|nr:MATE family efflux transporter [Haloprofundus marisrubri]KTG07970.1 MATE family efflux transporter [Haloprofundus marisrubri]